MGEKMKRVYKIRENDGKVKIPREFGMTTEYRNKIRKIKNLKIVLHFDLGEETSLERTVEETFFQKLGNSLVIIGVSILRGFFRFAEKVVDFVDDLVRR